jgi:hypothetical protein
MRNINKITVGFFLIIAAASNLSAKEWRGIVPYHSTREDVERLLGTPQPPPADGTRSYTLNKSRSIYFLEEGEVYIVYAEDEIPAAAECIGKVPAGTVMLIQITPKKKTKLGELGIDERRFKRFDPSEPKGIGYEGFIDEEEGLAIRTLNGDVELIAYVAAKKDKHLCPSYFENAEASLQVMVCGLGIESCPMIALDCPTDTTQVGDKVTFSVSVAGSDPNVTPTFNWTVNGGRIVEGQGTPTLIVDTSEVTGKAVEATITVGGYEAACPARASCNVDIVGGSSNRRSEAKPAPHRTTP